MSDFATPWTVAYQAFLSMGFSRQEYWSGMPSPSPGLKLVAGKMGHGLDPVDQELRMAFTFFKGLKKSDKTM